MDKVSVSGESPYERSGLSGTLIFLFVMICAIILPLILILTDKEDLSDLPETNYNEAKNDAYFNDPWQGY